MSRRSRLGVWVYGASLITLIASNVLAQEPRSPEGKTIAIPGAEIYYEEHGEGLPLLLLHPFGSTGSHWDTYVPALAEHYRVFVLDLRGRGRSSNHDTSGTWPLQLIAQDVLAFMDALSLARVNALGGSSGGSVVLAAATIQPSRFEAIVSVGGPPYRSDEIRTWIEEFLSAHPGPELIGSYIDRHGEDNAARIVNELRQAKDLYDDLLLTPDVLGTITSRTLIVHGDDDPIVPVYLAWEVFQSIPNAHLWIVPNGGHLPYTEASNVPDFTRRILEFFSGVADK